ncbi:VOC family protein [Nonomuraea sp. NPDC049152]
MVLARRHRSDRGGVLADPEGNEFCLLKARLDPL